MSSAIPSTVSSLELLRSRSTKILLTFLWLQIPTLILLGLFRSVDWQGTASSMALMAAIVSIYYKIVGNKDSTRYLISVATVLTPALMVYMLQGNEWQLDGHMYFFATFALLIGFCDWRCIALATIVIAVHHLLLNFTISYALFPDGADFFRVVFHALVVLIEAGVLIWVSFMLAKTLTESDEKIYQVNQAKAQMEVLAKEREATQIQVETSRKDAVNQLAKELRTSIGVMADEIERTADIMEISAVTLIDKVESSQSLAKQININTDETSQTVQMVTTAADELNSSIKEIAIQSGNSRHISENANNQAVATDKKVQELTEKANQIGQIVGLISKIAEQTNLLALNATIEAARAGDAGKGFAVVASEVKNLATETAKATEDITAQVTYIQHITRDTAQAIRDITKTIQSISVASSTIAGAVEEQSSATADIANNIQFAAESTANVSTNIRLISQNIAETNTASTNVGDQASNLKNSAIKLRTQLRDFLTKIEKS